MQSHNCPRPPVFAAISRKGRRGLDAGAKGYGAADPAEALLPVA